MPKSKEVIASGYGDAGASYSKRALKKFLAHSSSPIEDIDFYNATLRQRGRMLFMAAPLATSAVNTNDTTIVGTGLKMKCHINTQILGLSEQEAKKWQFKTESEFAFWAENKNNCDALGMNNFYELQSVALKSWLMSGDVFAALKRIKTTSRLNPYSLRIQLIEADRVCTPNKVNNGIYTYTEGQNSNNGNYIHDGVEVNSDGRVVAYHVCDVHPNAGFYSGKMPKWARVEAVGKKTGIPNILHVMNAERPDQYRGVTYLAPVIEVLLQHRRYTESELVAAVVQSFFTAFITSEADSTGIPFLDREEDEEKNDENGDRETIQLGPGEIVELKPGESITFGNPNIPTVGFEAFTQSIAKQVGAALEIPYDVLMKEFNSSYSASKGALEEAWKMFKKRRSWFVSDFCKPIYEAWLAEAVARGRISAPGFFTDPLIRAAWSGTRWDGPAQTHLDPLKEAKANAIVVSHGWKTNEQITREFYNGNYEENIQALSAENALSQGVLNNNNITFNDLEEEEENAEE
ncbi:MAG: phage portal protein [Oscillospiraceae bacterium]|nr:phage portal protein [Oscillospiraceae bacterium]